MDWSDVEYLLRKTYFQGWNFQKPLLNSRNALDLSYDGLLSKTSCDALKANQKLYQLTLDIYKRTENESEKLMIADMLDHYSEEMVLMLAKGLNYPTRPKQINNNLTDKFIENMTESFNNMIDLDSVQKTVDLADNALASLRKSGNNAEHNNNNIISNELISLTQSINNTNINGKGSVECISLLDDSKPNANINNPFMTAKQALAKNINQKSSVNSTNYSGSSASSASNNSYNPTAQARKILGAKRRFVDPKTETGYRDEGRDINTEFSYYNMNKAPQSVNTSNVNSNSTTIVKKPTSTTNTTSNASANANGSDEPIDERLAGIEPRLIEMIRNEIMHRVDNITWESIAGLEHAKSSIKEIVVWPMLRPDLFKGLRGPPKGLLLFGPPGTGKTLIGKCIASQAGATFFSISASSLTSKWVGEGEKMVRALFAVARCSQPAVIFIDEIDSLLTQRTDGEFEASRRIKTEFLVQFDGAGTNSEDRILVIGATNRPQEIDEAARRRLLKRLYIPLPEASARATIINNLLANQSHNLTEKDINWICEQTEGYSGSDMDGLCREAAIGPIRSITDILNISTSDVRPISREDFEEALSQVRASVSNQDLDLYLDWNQKFGSLNVKNNGK